MKTATLACKGLPTTHAAHRRVWLHCFAYIDEVCVVISDSPQLYGGLNPIAATELLPNIFFIFFT